MKPWWMKFVVMMAADGGEGGGGGAPAPSPAPAPAPAPSPAPAPGPAPSPSPSPSPSPAPAPAEPPDWRATFVGTLPENATEDAKREHEALVNLAKRYNSLPDAARALRAAQLKFSSGQVITKLPENATEAQVKEWRAENGIPETPDKYELKLEPGLVVSSEDKQMLAPILQAMHAVNARPDAVAAGVNAYFKMREEEIATVVADNQKAGKEMKIALSEEWGPRDYVANIEGVNAMLTTWGADVAKAFEQAAGPDGIQLIHNPAVMRALARAARESGFVGASLTPGGDLGSGVASRIEALQDMMAKDPDKYYGDEKYGKELAGLLTLQRRQGGGSRNG